MAMTRLGAVLFGIAIWGCTCPSGALGQESTSVALSATEIQAQLEQVEQAASDAALAGHNAWMLGCTALVLFMTAPGVAMFYSGLIRKKNVLGVMMQCIFLMGLMTVVWVLWGYSFCFGGDGLWFGDGEYLMMRNVSRFWDSSAGAPVTPMFATGEPTQIPLLTHVAST